MTAARGVFDANLEEAAALAVVELPERKRVFSLESIEDLMAEPDPQFWVEGLLKRGDLFMFYGAPKSGKTFATIDLFIQAGKGEGKFAGQFEINQRLKVAYATAEGQAFLKYRIRAAMERHDVSPRECADYFRIVRTMPNLFSDSSNRNTDQFIEDLRDWEPDVIVMDTLALAMVSGDENATKDAGIVLENTMRIREEINGCAVGFIHHANKGGGMRGNTTFAGAMDAIVKFGKTGTGERTMESDGMKDAPEFDPIRFDLEQIGESARGQAVAWQGRAAGARKVSASERLTRDLVELLRIQCVGLENAKTVSELRELLEGQPTQQKIGDCLRELRQGGLSMVRGFQKKDSGGSNGRLNRILWHYYWDEL